MTPSKDEMSPKPLKNPDNYDIHDLKSDEVRLVYVVGNMLLVMSISN